MTELPELTAEDAADLVTLHLDFEITELTAMSGGAEQLSLWQANVHAEWPSPYDGAAAP